MEFLNKIIPFVAILWVLLSVCELRSSELMSKPTPYASGLYNHPSMYESFLPIISRRNITLLPGLEPFRPSPTRVPGSTNTCKENGDRSGRILTEEEKQTLGTPKRWCLHKSLCQPSPTRNYDSYFETQRLLASCPLTFRQGPHIVTVHCDGAYAWVDV